MAILHLDLTKFSDDEHYTVVELIYHTVKAGNIENHMAKQRCEALGEAFQREGELFRELHKKYGSIKLDEIDRLVFDTDENSLQNTELFRMCADEDILNAADKMRRVRQHTDQAYEELMEVLNALLVVSPNETLSQVETQLNHQVSYVSHEYGKGDGIVSEPEEKPLDVKERCEEHEDGDARVRLMTLPLQKKNG